MRLGRPEFLILGLFVPLVAATLFFAYRRGRSLIQLLSRQGRDSRLLVVYAVKSFFSGILFLGFVGLAILALADISWAEEGVYEARSGLELVFVVDTSRSMLAADLDPDRITRALDLLGDVVKALPGARFGVVAFKGRALRLVPITEDRAIIDSVEQVLGAAVLSSRGTNIEAALEEAIDSFPPGSDRSKVIVLFSDGESLSGDPARAARRAGDIGIPVFAVGLGSREGAVIKLEDGSLVSDASGRPVVTRMNEVHMRTLSDASGGRYYDGSDAKTLSAILDDLGALQAESGSPSLVPVKKYRFFLGSALLVLALLLVLWGTKWFGVL